MPVRQPMMIVPRVAIAHAGGVLPAPDGHHRQQTECRQKDRPATHGFRTSLVDPPRNRTQLACGLGSLHASCVRLRGGGMSEDRLERCLFLRRRKGLALTKNRETRDTTT